MIEIIIYSFALLILIGAIYQFISNKLDKIKYPPMGKIINIGNRSLHAIVSHNFKHGPTIILEAGNGLSSSSWMLIQPEIAKFANCISYDRAGLGWSDQSKETSYTSTNDIHDLSTLLDQLKLPEPYLLVGHSYGGMLSRLYASCHPEKVAGLVLVDAYHEKQLDIIPLPSRMTMNVLNMMSIFGLFRLFIQNLFPLPKSLPTQMRKRIYAELSAYSWIKTTKSIFSNVEHIVQEFHNLPIINKPVIVISAGQHTGLELKFENKINELQKDLVSQSTHGRQIIAEKSGHNIPFTQPEIIIQAVHDLVFETVSRSKYS